MKNLWLLAILQFFCAGVITGVGLTALIVTENFTATTAIWCFAICGLLGLLAGVLLYKRMTGE